MYVPKAFSEDRAEELHAIMRSCSLPVLVSQVRDDTGVRMTATHLPLLLRDGRLIGHVARANDHWRSLDTDAESLAIFSGVDGYISPSLYATKNATGRVVPTWNYEAVHAYGRLEVIEDRVRILDVVGALTDQHEQKRKTPWKVADAPEDYITAQLKGIVALVMHVTRLQGVRKLSQNKSPDDRAGVLAGQAEENPTLAAHMERFKTGR